MRLLLRLAAFAALGCAAFAQTPPSDPVPAPTAEEIMLRRIFSEALVNGRAYANLTDLVAQYPGRISGSKKLDGAIGWAQQLLGSMGLDRVYTQDVMVPHWERGAKESVLLQPSHGEAVPLTAVALGGSVPTPEGGITAEVVEVTSLDQLKVLGREKLAGKIVFFNRPMDPAAVSPGPAYGAAGDGRNRGPGIAGTYGAVGALTRSLTHTVDDVPHTGVTAYIPDQPRIPAAALSMLASNRLSAALAGDPHLRVEIKIHSQWFPDALSRNTIGEIRGSEFPDQVILVGGHLDSWDIAPGAHDDGAGVVESIEVLRLFKALGLKPRHTLRCVLFTAEEPGGIGGAAYASAAKGTAEKHVFAVETDSGGFQPRGFNIGSTQGDAHLRAAARWHTLFEPYGIFSFVKGPGGTDVNPLLLQGVTVAGLMPDSQRYFDIHHTTIDSLDKVNPRELHLGAAALASLIWLVDTQGL